MTIQIMLQFNGKQLTIPINPEEITIDRNADNDDIDIIGLGKATRKGEPSLRKLKISSFFPSENSYFYTGVKPKTCTEFIEEIWKTENINNNVAKIVTIGLPKDVNMYFVIENFSYSHKAGEEQDIYYELAIKEYKPYGVKTVDVQLSGLASARAVSPVIISQDAPSPEIENKTYTVQKGDCLWNITKACTGNGTDWQALYELNKEIIGNNPNLIKPGQVLTLPQGWNPPTNVTKLKSSTQTKNTTISKNNTIVKERAYKIDKDIRLNQAKAKIDAYKSGIVIPTRR